jgi:hypothetical protein
MLMARMASTLWKIRLAMYRCICPLLRWRASPADYLHDRQATRSLVFGRVIAAFGGSFLCGA